MTAVDTTTVDEFEERHPLTVDIGCGDNKRDPDAVGVDFRDTDDVDLVHDIEDGLPFASNTVDRVYAYSVLEHVEDLPGVMAELHRVCRGGAIVEGKVPHWKDRNAYIDPTHVRFFDERTFYFWDSALFPHQPSYFDVEYRVQRSSRIWRVQFWKSRPIWFELEVVK